MITDVVSPGRVILADVGGKRPLWEINNGFQTDILFVSLVFNMITSLLFNANA